jgi:hypothetical protein
MLSGLQTCNQRAHTVWPPPDLDDHYLWLARIAHFVIPVPALLPLGAISHFEGRTSHYVGSNGEKVGIA